MMKKGLRQLVSLLVCIMLLCTAVQASALETVERNGKKYLADWDDTAEYHFTGMQYGSGSEQYYVMEDGEVPTGWFRDKDGKWHYANSDGLISGPWHRQLENIAAIQIPADVDAIDIDELSGIRRDTVFYVTPGSYG